MNKTLHIFDFDGTLTHKDSLLEFIKLTKGTTKLYVALALHSPFLIGMKLGLYSNSRAKEKVFSFLYKGTELSEFNSWCKEFYDSNKSSLFRKSALQYLEQIDHSNSELVMVSASIKNWLEPFSNGLKMGLLSTEIEVVDGRLTGKFAKPNCYGQEKVNRIKEKFDLDLYEEIHVYGDSSGDTQMLALATHTYFKYFK